MTTRIAMKRHLPNTNAYITLKRQTQSTFDFITVVSYGVAALRRQLALVDKGVIKDVPLPDGFRQGNDTNEQLRDLAKDYKQQLSSSAFLSLFSYFEAFVKAAITEMLEFHGGPEAFQRKAEAHDREFLREEEALETIKQRVRKRREPGKVHRHEKYTRELLKLGYRFPSELFSSYGVRLLVQRLGNLRAADIPDVLVHGLHMNIDADDIKLYGDAREMRNRIAHGVHVPLSVRKVSEKNDVLRRLSIAIDRHLNLHYMVSEDSVV